MKKRLSLMLCALVAVFTVCVLASCGGDGNDSTQNADDTTQFGGAPYNKTIGNGNYTVHNFLSDSANFTMTNFPEVTNHYLTKGGEYVKGLANDLSNSLNGRPAAQNYFSSLINAVKNENRFYIDEYDPSNQNFDKAVNTIDSNVAPIMADVIENIDNKKDRRALYYIYSGVANYGYYEGLGKDRNDTSSSLVQRYEDQKNFIKVLASTNDRFSGLNLDEEFDSNNFRNMTNIMDDLVETAVANINKRQNLDLRAADIRQVINLGFTTNSFEAMHDVTDDGLKHNNCALSLNTISEMGQATSLPILSTQQEQGMTY